MTARETVDQAEKKLEKAGIPDARLDAEKLLGRLLGWSQLDLIARAGEAVAAGQKKKFDAMVTRRAKREPLQYLTGVVDFAGLKLDIDKRALIPRPETEALVDAVLKHQTDQPARALDACCGSGAVALALKKAWPALEVTASDLSLDALRLARQNAKRLELDVHFVRADLFGPFVRPFHFITINPPYIRTADYASLQPEVRDFEPRLALDGGEDGLRVLSRLAEEAAPILWPGGHIAIECSPETARDVADSLDRARAFDSISTLKDFQGHDRIIVARRWKSS